MSGALGIIEPTRWPRRMPGAREPSANRTPGNLVNAVEMDIQERLGRIEERLAAIETKLDECVDASEFGPVRAIVFGAVGLILSAVVIAVISGVIGGAS